MAEEKKEKELNLEELKKKLEEYKKQKAEYLAGWQRSRADFLNYKKEEIERIEEILKYADEELILKFLLILDNFYLVEKRLSENLKKDESVKGILQVKTQILDLLKNQGVKEIKVKIGDKFNPNFQEAVEAESASAEASADKAGTILEEIQKGYTLHDKVLRPAKVKVAK
jgi:molecular chaperone GrpE